jgi:predicted permease
VRSFWQDVRYGLRMLGKNPGFTTIAILTLALGIGANTAIFSIFNQILLKRLPVKNPGELVMLKSPGPKYGHIWSDGDDAEVFSYPIYKGIAQNNTVFDGVFARFEFGTSVASKGQTDRGSGELVTGNYFETLGVQPAVGRLITPADDVMQGAHPVVVLSHGYWTRHFANDPGALNQVILVNNTQLTVIGVAQAGFTGIQVGESPDLFVPIAMKGQMTPIRNGLDDWNDSFLAVFARLRPGVSRAQAQAAINVTYKPLVEQDAATLPRLSQGKDRDAFLAKRMVLVDGSQGRTTLQRDNGPALMALFGMVILVLLIACTNVANLLMAKGSARQREFAIRSAMGASRARMIWQLQIESLLCALAGGLMGLVLANWLMNILVRMIVSDTGIMGLTSQMDGKILAFALGTTVLSALLFGLFPAWRVTRTALSQTLKDQGTAISSGPTHVRFRKFLVAGQVAFTLLLLVGAALFTRTLWNLRGEKLGLNTENMIAFSIAPQLNGYNTAHAVTLIDGIRERLASTPGVLGVGSSEIAVLTGTDMGGNINVDGRTELPDDERHVNFNAVSPNYFSTLGVALISGRELRSNDTANSTKVCVISESLAKAFFVNRNPLGSHLAIGRSNVTPDIEIVGVVKDLKQDHVRTPVHSFVYFPYTQVKSLMGMTFYVRTQQEPLTLANSLRGVVREMDANLPVFNLKTFQRVIDEDLFAERIIAGLSATFGGLAALLAALGIYGVLAYLVLQRTREIGIRMALGAATGSVRALIYREVGVMIALGAILGLPAAFGLAELSKSLLFGVQAGSPAIYALSLAIICLVAAAACFLPSRRATRIDPIVALRYE